MKETRSISLNGLVFNIEYDAYQSLSGYLSDIDTRLPMDEKQDVMVDVEARVAELFQKALFAKNVQVISLDMVKDVQMQIGSPADFGENRRPRVKGVKTQNSGCRRILTITLKIVLILIAIQILIPIFSIVFACSLGLFGVSLGCMTAFPMLGFGFLTATPWHTAMLVACAFLTIVLPIVMLIYTIVVHARSHRGPKAGFWIVTILLWVLSLGGIVGMMVQSSKNVGGIAPLIHQISQWVDNEDDFVLPSEMRSLAPFTAIEVKGNADVKLSASPDYMVQIQSTNNANILTSVQDSVLYIEVPDSKYDEAEISLALPELKRLHLAGNVEVETSGTFVTPTMEICMDGAGKIRIAMQTNELIAQLRGAGKMNLEGSAKTANLLIAGAGKVESEWLDVDYMHINCSGAAKAEVLVHKQLWAQASGASKIAYKGNPVVSQSMAVGASAIRKN